LQCKCGFEIPENFKFCPECGKKAPKPKPPEPEFADQPIIKEVDPILTPAEAAKLLKISRWTLTELRIQNKLPVNSYFELPQRNGAGKLKTVRYRTKELLAWVGAVEGPITTAG